MTQVDVAYESLRDDITDWKLQPWTVLSEIEISNRLGMSRTPVREALKRLAREGLVRDEVGRSAVVAPMSIEEAIHIYQVREALETYAIRLAARGVERDGFAQLIEPLERLLARKTADPDEIYEISARFDQALWVAAANPYLTEMLTQLASHTRRLRRLVARRPEIIRDSAEQQLHIAQAILAGNGAEAARIGAERLANGLHAIVEILSSSLLGPLDNPALAGSDAP
jgi:GntR family transcriptional regulator, rspAB operon transcriptional repressor